MSVDEEARTSIQVTDNLSPKRPIIHSFLQAQGIRYINHHLKVVIVLHDDKPVKIGASYFL